MSKIEEHRGVVFCVPDNADGVWRFKIHPGRLRGGERRPLLAPAEGYITKASAVAGAKAAIDFWLLARCDKAVI